MGGGVRRWLSSFRRALAHSSCKSTTVAQHSSPIHEKHEQLAMDRQEVSQGEGEEEEDEDGEGEEEEDEEEEEEPEPGANCGGHQPEQLSVEDLAAIKLQACFRGHLARRAFRALRSLVKMQALVRGVHVRRQTRLAAHCMQALARLHFKVRTRKLLTGTVHAQPNAID